MRRAFRFTAPSRAAAVLVTCALVGVMTPRLSAGQVADYVIGPQDSLSITVFDQAELTGKYAVELDGSFAFPFVGRVQAAGLTIRAVEVELKKKLTQGFLKNPQVSVAIDEYRSQRIFIVGEVRNVGPHPLTGGMTLVEALAKAGSTTPAAGDEVVVVRGGGAGDGAEPIQTANKETVRVSLKELQSGVATAANVALRDGDMIYVPRAELVYLLGEVKNPGSYAIQSGMTVLQAFSLAGGVTQYGAPNRVEVIRLIKGVKKTVKVKLDDLVQPGDTIVVPERFF